MRVSILIPMICSLGIITFQAVEMADLSRRLDDANKQTKDALKTADDLLKDANSWEALYDKPARLAKNSVTEYSKCAAALVELSGVKREFKRMGPRIVK